MAAGDIMIFHNPGCGTSRNALALLRERGFQPKVIDYLKAGWTRPHLQALLKKMDATLRDILRVRGTPESDLGLTDPAVSDARLLDAMVAHPILVERPIVETPHVAVLGRPRDKVSPLLAKMANR